MLAAAARVTHYAAGMSSAGDLTRDRQAFEAILYNLFVLGEAAKAVPVDVRDRWPDIEWRRMAGLRDVLAHEYFGIDDEIIWDVVKSKLPVLIAKVGVVIAAIERDVAGGAS